MKEGLYKIGTEIKVPIYTYCVIYIYIIASCYMYVFVKGKIKLNFCLYS